ncbi:sensor histidine kinase [Pseudomonas aeruginosa]|uniref:ATP-binding protein n=1 Tax=Pseudomonadaceae TaxID=135621 RepID=UPI0016257CB4|nr:MULTISPECIES: ATP-binding protein [Pseudomonadaceae]MBG7303441.1 sensor histidine kinase [Pseudomonas aeruginosa]MDH0184920.1 ATP-binding protein [Stutzerimonas stutzeri]MDH1249166.1 ATP-binding protein [Stutzerimonas stutzeri]HBP6433537.1 ATP-binding protein [Pseudomonas aeruginosa]
MSNVNIKRAVENIRANTTVYTPVVEMIVNAIQAIDEAGRKDGKVQVRAQRSAQIEQDGSLPEVTGFDIEDNGIGFTDANRNSFDTLYTDLKIAEGGKGFGRFTGLKYFEDLHVKSDYHDGIAFKARSFSMGKEHEIIVHEKVAPSDKQDTGTVVTLAPLKAGRSFDKKLSTIARSLAERLLPYFITQDYVCPDIVLSEQDGSGAIRLNDFVSNELSAVIREIGVDRKTFTIKASDTEEEFLVRVFKLYSPRNQKSRISLVAHKREVSGAAIHKYIPEFVDEFFEKDRDGEIDSARNYIIKAYVFGPYLDRNVSLERGGFEFQMESDLILGIGQTQIEQDAASIAREAMGADITFRQEKKKERVQSYVDEEAPWHKAILERIDLNGMPYNPSNEEIETRLQKEKFAQEIAIKRDVAKLMAETNFEDVQDSVIEIVNKISGTSKNDLIHYIALRRKILDIFGKSLEIDESGTYSSEGVVHDIIFPRKGDTDITSFHDHNLWIVDERLNFTTYVSSDLPLNGGNTDRPDLLVYNKRVLFRGDNEASNPITIFEFKKPQRDDFVNPSSREDPIQQIVRYVNDIRDGKYKTPEGRKILVAENTPFYGYVVCDLTAKVETWLEREKNFTPMPDRLGWFQWMGNINLYVEVISWDKVLKDAKMRSQIFFQKLGI